MLPLDPGLRLEHVEITDQGVTLSLSTTDLTVCCPGCEQPTRHAHSRYLRIVRDLPIQGRPVMLHLSARRFFCRNPDCPRRVFCEPIPQLLAKHARSTTRLMETHRTIGLALGGEPGSRLAGKLSMPASPDTLLRRVKKTRESSPPPSRIVGVDDWALRKGHTYGTIIVDLERSEVLELLPGRDGGELKTWLSDHPEVEVLSRDRWSPYADAAAASAPQAEQVADRWHLLKNIREALKRFLDRHTKQIAAALTPSAPNAADETANPESLNIMLPFAADPVVEDASEPSADTPNTPPQPAAKQQQRQERWKEVRQRQSEGQSLRRIAREMRLSWRIVQRYVNSTHCPNWRPGRTGPSRAANYQQRIDAWLAEGNRNVAALHRQLQAEGSPPSYSTLKQYVSRRLAAVGLTRPRANAAKPPSPPAPSTKSLSFAVIANPDKRTPKQLTHLAHLQKLNSEVAETVGLVEAFASLIRRESESTPQEWQTKARSSDSPELKRFAEGLERDQAAVQAALTQRFSNGPVEGHINWLKMIKRQMYGRASLALMRARVLRAALPAHASFSPDSL